MSRAFPLRPIVAGCLGLGILAGCSTLAPPKPFVFEHESFDNVGTYSREVSASPERACAAAQRALLSQGYIMGAGSNRTDVVARKNFQQNAEQHVEVEFHVVCTANADGHSTAFATALQDTFALKKTNNSASLGVSAIGSVSMPISSISDSMVKVASATIPTVSMYDRFFELMFRYLVAFEQDGRALAPPAGSGTRPAALPEADTSAAAVPVPAPAPGPTVPAAGFGTQTAPAPAADAPAAPAP